MPGLAHAISRYDDRKREHLTPAQTRPGGRRFEVDDGATLDRLMTGTGVDGPEAAAGAAFVVAAAMKQVRRAGILRGAKQDDLRALLFALWLDGLTTGLIYDRTADANAEAGVRPCTKGDPCAEPCFGAIHGCPYMSRAA